MTLTLSIKVYPPTTNVRKYFVPTKILANFQIRSSNYNEEVGEDGEGGGQAETFIYYYVKFITNYLTLWRLLHSVILYYALVIFSSQDCFNFTIL